MILRRLELPLKRGLVVVQVVFKVLIKPLYFLLYLVNIAHKHSLSVKVLFFVVHPVEFHSNKHFLEFHDVLGECACLVREDVVDLPELLDDTGCLNLGKLHVFHREHLHVILNEKRLDHLYHLKRDR